MINSYFKTTFIALCFVFLFFLWSFVFSQSQTILTMSINPWQLSYDSPAYLNLWQINLSESQQNIQWQFDDYFWVSDLMWLDDWYSTNIQCDWLYGANGVVLSWIYLKAWNINPTLILWNPWNVFISPHFSDYYPINNWPVIYIYREAGANYWTINKYWDMPWIRVTIPPYTQPWTYSWIIFFDI